MSLSRASLSLAWSSIPVRWIVALAFAIGLLVAVPAAASADTGDVGFEGPAGAGAAPSGSKPESKLWYNDGFWWASMWDTTTSDNYIWKLDQATETWTRTGTRLDDRSSTRADVLWDGSKLYVASHQFSENDGSGTSRLYRLSYNTSTDTYSVDSGFPKTINSLKTETLVIAKDSTGKLWATWEQGGKIYINHTTNSSLNWGTAFQVPGSANVNADDISSIIAFGGNKIGVFWSNQVTQTDYFSVHTDGTADATGWVTETAYSGTLFADDHMNLKTDAAGRVYSIVKTSLDSPPNAASSPYIVLLVRQTNGTWSSNVVSTASNDQTRPILEIDETNNLLRVFATSSNNGGTINQHTSPISAISFPGGAGTVVMKDASALKLNNASSTKQNITSATGLIVLAYNDTTNRYWHADILNAPPVNAPPTANATSATTAQDTATPVALSGSDPETCDLTFSVVSGPSHGSVGSITPAACAPGSPNADTASVTYTPNSGYFGPDSFTYKVNDGSADSTPATASLTISPAGGGGTFTYTPAADAQVKSTSATTNYGSLGTMQLRQEPTGGTNATYYDYLKFNVSGMSGTVASLKLRLFITDVSPDSGTVYGVSDTSWGESTITWNTAPATGSSFGSAGATTTAGTWVEIPLNPAAVSGNGLVSFALKTTSSNSSIYSTKEGTNPPELVITTSGGDTTPPVLQSIHINGSALTLNYNETLDGASDPTNTDLTLAVNGNPVALSSIDANGTTVTATAASPVLSTDTVTASYTPGGAPIQDVAGNDAASFSGTGVTNDTPPSDTTAPSATTSTVNGTSLVINFDEAVANTAVPAGAFAVQGSGSGAHTTNTVGIAGSAVTLTLATPVVNGETVNVTYAKPGSAPWVQDAAGNPTATFTLGSTNNTPPADTTAPAKTGQTVNGSTLVVTYDETLDSGSVPSASAYDVQVGGSSRGVSNVLISGSSVTLTLASPVTSADSVTVAYSAPGVNPVQDAAGNDSASFAAVAVTNNTPPPNTAPTADSTSATTPFQTGVSVALSGSDPETCNLTFSIVSGPSHGSVGSISNGACVAGSPNTDTASVTYTPANGYSGPDSFTYKVNDGTTDSAPATATLTVSPPAGGTFTFTPTDDAQVKSTSPTTNYGSLASMQLREEPPGGTLPTYRDYFKFTVSGLSGTVTAVKLRLYITDVSPDSGTVFAVADTSWTEGAITWNTAPALGATSLGAAGATTTANAYIEITLSPSSITGNGTYSFGLKTTSTNSSIFDSSEGANTPQLVVTTS